MVITFNIINQKIDLTYQLTRDNGTKEWWFYNAYPKIPIETKIEDLTNDQKKSLIKLAIYEGLFDPEMLCNQSNESFQLITNDTNT